MAFASSVARRPMGMLLLPLVLLLQPERAVAAESNPLRRVITMLQMMKKKVEAEGQKEAKVYDMYMCYCKGSMDNLKKSIAKGEKKVPQLTGELKGGKEAVEQYTNDLQAGKADREQVKTKIQESTELRSKEKEEYDKEVSQAKANIAALGKAIVALSKGMEGGFLQTPAADVLRQLVKTPKVGAADSEVLTVFLSEEAGSAYSPVSGQVVGICKQLKESMEGELVRMEQQEAQAARDFNEMLAASKKELAAITAMIETKLGRKGKQKVSNVIMEEDLDSSSEALEEDKIFYKETDEKCAVIENTYRKHQGMRSEELVTLADTITILSNDDSLETLKKATSKEPVSFLQLGAGARASRRDRRREALKLLKMTRKNRRGHGSAKLDLLELALHGKAVGFDKIIKMIDGMIGILQKEQTADDKKRDYCKKELDNTEDALKTTNLKREDSVKEIKDDTAAVETTQAEIDDLVESITTSDRMVGEATAARKANSGAYVELISSNRAALQIIDVAEKRLMKFYNKKLKDFHPPEEEDDDPVEARTEVNPNEFGPGAMTMMRGMTGKFLQTEATGADFLQVGMTAPSFLQEPYKKKQQGSAGILELLNSIKIDIRRDSEEAAIEEQNHANSYQLMLKEAAKKREIAVKTLTEKEDSKSALVAEIEHLKGVKKSAHKQILELSKFMKDLKGECDWFMENYPVRKEAREAEREALVRAKDVLSGGVHSQ